MPVLFTGHILEGRPGSSITLGLQHPGRRAHDMTAKQTRVKSRIDNRSIYDDESVNIQRYVVPATS